jgi:glyoxalase family protein
MSVGVMPNAQRAQWLTLPYETLGEKLSLPPFPEPQREVIETYVRPINSVRGTIEFISE